MSKVVKLRNTPDDKLESAVIDILSGIGEDPKRNGLLKTPHRVAKSLKFLTKGYEEDPFKVINDAIFEEDVNEMVVIKNIELYSLCEHHMLPFVGQAHVAYIPNGKIVGISKIARIIEIFARRLQVQERLTKEIADTLDQGLKPRGVAVVIQANHLCMQMRGVQKQNSQMVTSAMSGEFLKSATRSEFMDFIKASL